ncbi:hypothetical protein PMAYCL1PPCAC_04831, partial [Pristionchus mayeri]
STMASEEMPNFNENDDKYNTICCVHVKTLAKAHTHFVTILAILFIAFVFHDPRTDPRTVVFVLVFTGVLLYGVHEESTYFIIPYTSFSLSATLVIFREYSLNHCWKIVKFTKSYAEWEYFLQKVVMVIMVLSIMFVLWQVYILLRFLAFLRDKRVAEMNTNEQEMNPIVDVAPPSYESASGEKMFTIII